MYGTVNSPSQLESTFQPLYDDLTQTVGCSDAEDTLECLRAVAYEDLFEVLEAQLYQPILDGTFFTRLPSESVSTGLIADVAILAGTNTDEGTASFFGPRGTLNNDTDVHDYLSGLGVGLDEDTVATIMELYPDDPTLGCPFGTGEERFADQGYQYKRGAAIAGDISMQAGRRSMTNYYAQNSEQPVFSYRFDQPPWNGVLTIVNPEPPTYATHYVEVGCPSIILIRPSKWGKEKSQD